MNDSRKPKTTMSRRTIIGAAAWSAPVIALSVASPAVAASGGTATVQIVNASTLTEAATSPGRAVLSPRIAATTDGTAPAPAGDTITVSLPAGLTFSDGTTTKAYTASGATTSIDIPAEDIIVARTTAPGAYTITVLYRNAVAVATARVVEGGLVYAWGINNINQAGLSPAASYVTTPTMWAPPAGHAGFYGYRSIAGSNSRLFAHSDVDQALRVTAVTSAPSEIFRGSESVVGRNEGMTADAATFWGADGLLYGWGENVSNLFSFSDRRASVSTAAPIGEAILAANPGRSIIGFNARGRARGSYLLSDNTVWNSGANENHAMGIDGTAGATYLAAQTVTSGKTPLADIVDVSGGYISTLYLDSSGRIWGSGYNQYGQLPGTGMGTTTAAAVALTQPNGMQVSRIWSHNTAHLVLTTDGDCYHAGANASGFAGTGTNATSPEWTRVLVPDGKTIADIAPTAARGALYLMTDGTVYFAGSNITGGAGSGTAGGSFPVMVPVPLPGPANEIAVTQTGTFAAILS